MSRSILCVGAMLSSLMAQAEVMRVGGLGMYVREGARKALTHNEKKQFIDAEVLAFLEQARLLAMDVTEVVDWSLAAGRGKT